MLAVAATVGAAISINAGYVLQHRGLVRAPSLDLRRPVAVVLSLLSAPRWLAGAALGYAGIVLEFLALTALPLSAVQAAIGAGLVVVAASSDSSRGRFAPPAAALAIVALIALTVVMPRAAHARVAPAAWTVSLACMLIAALGAGIICVVRGPIGLALSSGVLYGATSVAEAVLAPALVGTPPPLGVIAAAVILGVPLTAAAFLCFQRALQDGRPLAVVTAMMASMNAVAMGCGVLVLGDPLAANPIARAVQLAALALTAASGLLVLGERLTRT
ncbi:hypothetical protein [Solirubrobacter soli]|uniref:hypothetical protein n=1 Tax=Solirubrobacter soli TaxID=363832 RepID=UPI00042437DF|nr:hypothetical protein [Solirubrobacter soli]